MTQWVIWTNELKGCAYLLFQNQSFTKNIMNFLGWTGQKALHATIKIAQYATVMPLCRVKVHSAPWLLVTRPLLSISSHFLEVRPMVCYQKYQTYVQRDGNAKTLKQRLTIRHVLPELQPSFRFSGTETVPTKESRILSLLIWNPNMQRLDRFEW